MQFIYPSKVLFSENFDNPETLLLEKKRQIGLNEVELTSCEKEGSIVLDFGKEMNGSIRVLTFMADENEVRLRFGESLTETFSEVGGEKNATNDHSLRDFKVKLTKYSDMTFGNTGFRFLRIDVKGSVSIKSIIAVNNILEQKSKYEYKGKDEQIKEIFAVAKRTIDLCSAGEYVWDGVKRDRLVWIGDLHPEMLALTTLYGRMKKLEDSLDFVREQTPIDSWMNGIPSYSLWWIIILADYIKDTKAYDFAQNQADYLDLLVNKVDASISDKGDINHPMFFADWPTFNQPEAQDGVRAICIIAIKKAIDLLKRFKKSTETAKNALFKLMKKEIVPNGKKQIIALKYFAVGLSKVEKQQLIQDAPEGFSTFMSYYILKAIASFDKKKAVRFMKEYFGKMIEKGATTFWEDFNMSWAENSCRIDELPKEGEIDIHGDCGDFCYKGFRHSLCHGWSSGVIAFIKEYC